MCVSSLTVHSLENVTFNCMREMKDKYVYSLILCKWKWENVYKSYKNKAQGNIYHGSISKSRTNPGEVYRDSE